MITPKPLHTYSGPLGAGAGAAGTFHFDVRLRKLQWSEGLYLIHGYKRGDVLPTPELVLSHIHPQDRGRTEELLAAVLSEGGRFCSYHRVLDSRRHERTVLSSGEGLVDEAGRVWAVEGYSVDLSATVQKEIEQASREAVERAMRNRGTIERAKGILMGYLGIGSDAAFGLLLTRSQHTNVKVARIAAELVDAADTPAGPGRVQALISSLQHQPHAPALQSR